MSEATVTTDHEEIRRWAVARNGHPARVRGTGSNGKPGILRIEFPGHRGPEALERIS